MMGRYLIMAISIALILSISFWLFRYIGSRNQVGKINFESKPMNIRSEVFEAGESIPDKYTCDGDNINPPLEFGDVPEDAVSLVLIVHDPDVPKRIREDGIWDHWLIWKIDPTTTHIEEGSALGVVGKNTGGNRAYTGPCPPDGQHRYFFTLYALDTDLELDPETVSRDDLLEAMRGHILDEAELMGVYNRQN